MHTLFTASRGPHWAAVWTHLRRTPARFMRITRSSTITPASLKIRLKATASLALLARKRPPSCGITACSLWATPLTKPLGGLLPWIVPARRNFLPRPRANRKEFLTKPPRILMCWSERIWQVGFSSSRSGSASLAPIPTCLNDESCFSLHKPHAVSVARPRIARSWGTTRKIFLPARFLSTSVKCRVLFHSRQFSADHGTQFAGARPRSSPDGPRKRTRRLETQVNRQNLNGHSWLHREKAFYPVHQDAFPVASEISASYQ